MSIAIALFVGVVIGFALGACQSNDAAYQAGKRDAIAKATGSDA